MQSEERGTMLSAIAFPGNSLSHIDVGAKEPQEILLYQNTHWNEKSFSNRVQVGTVRLAVNQAREVAEEELQRRKRTVIK
jgi:hypothetical protein